MIRSIRWNLSTLSTGALLVALAAAAAPARAAVYTVTKTADTADGACNSDCSLREAILAANANHGADFILLPAGTYTLTLAGAGEDQGATGDLDIRDDVAIVGASAASTILDGGQLDRVLDIPAGIHVEIQGVTIRNGRVAGAGGGIRNAGTLDLSQSLVTANSASGSGTGFGGGISSDGTGSQLNLSQSTVSGNTADAGGGGLALSGPAQVSESTVSGNRSNSYGGGIYVFAKTKVVFAGVTITGNTAANTGGGIFTEVAPFISVDVPELRDSIVAGNTGAPQRDCTGPVQSDGYNLMGDATDCVDFQAAHHDVVGTAAAPADPKLGPLVNNGGPTPTHALLAGSPALGQSNSCEASDQRGQTRPASGCDIGAFQTGTECLTGGPTLCLNNDRFRVTTQWRTQQGTSGSGQGVSLTGDSGYFWFFNPSNIEMTVKVLNGCGLTHHYWVFLSGLTNVDVTVAVTDTKNGTAKTYHNPLGTTFKTILDTNAFATCP
jgi:CSLREA domain-containing protein